MSKSPTNNSKSNYLLPIIIGLGIIFGTVVAYVQIYDYQQQYLIRINMKLTESWKELSTEEKVVYRQSVIV